jgi:biofilm PGA synthesis N-glycosyltransferase PgaC
MFEAIVHWIQVTENTAAYDAALRFYGLYPLVTAIVWATTALAFYLRRERSNRDQPEAGATPRVSVLIPAYCEEAVVAQSVRSALELDYPNFEVILINDGSTDGTRERVTPFLSDPRFHLLDKDRNEGKGRALNDGIARATGDLVLIMDADAIPERDLLRFMVPHFANARVAAIAGNARVRNKNGVLAKLQAIEFTSIISLLRRAQRVWGAIMCVSGVVGMFRKSVLIEAGLFSPGMATEDIDLTWKIQKLGYDIRYEPRAMVWMIVPETFQVWWKQRRRWALGLGQVLRRHSNICVSWKLRRMLPLYVEGLLSTLWAIDFVLVTLFWLISYSLGHPPRGGSPFPNLWGMMLVTVCMLQLFCGVFIDFRYEPKIVRSLHLAPLYPVIYWMLLAVSTSIYTVKGLFQPLNLDKPTLWRIDHKCEEGVVEA